MGGFKIILMISSAVLLFSKSDKAKQFYKKLICG